MNERFERVVVELESAGEIEVAIDTAARLAARWRVPLYGIFIEDEELLGLAGLPFSSQVTLGAVVERLSLEEIKHHFRAFAERVKRELAAAAAPHRLEWGFAAVRGRVSADLLRPHDFIVASAATRPVGGHFRVRARLWPGIGSTRHPLLLTRRRWETGGSVLTFLRQGGAGAERLLALAAEIADFAGRQMTVLGEIAAEEGRERALDDADRRPPAPKAESGAGVPALLKERIRALDGRLLALAVEGARPEDLHAIVEAALCDLLVIGEEGGAASEEAS